MSRISTYMMSQRSITAMLAQQAKVSDTQQQLSTGKRVLVPSDDPASAARLLGINGAIGTVEQYQNNADRAKSRLESEESILTGVTDALQRASELAVQGNNDTLSGSDTRAIALEIRQLLDHTLSLANTRDGNGEYLFAGFQSKTRPFTQAGAGDFSYQGDLGQRKLQISPDRQIPDGDGGFSVFMNVATEPAARGDSIAATTFGAIAAGDIRIDGGNGNGPIALGALPAVASASERATQLREAINGVSSQTGIRVIGATLDTLTLTSVGSTGIEITQAGTANPANTGLPATIASSTTPRSVFETLDQLATELESNRPVDRYIADLQHALEHIVSTRASVGARLNAIDGQIEINADLKLSLEIYRSEEQDLDYAEAIARFERQMTALQAAQQSYVKIKGLSLFNYL
jgi:flagellar hook-associated protein 3 FlgL